MRSFEPHDGLYRLVPEEGVTTNNGRFVATSTCPWLRVEPADAFARHRWICLRYASSFFDEPVRPLIRFTTKEGGSFVQPMNGAVLGSADWIGRVPDETVAVAISPCRRRGPFSFRIDEMLSASLYHLLTRGIIRDWRWAYWAMRSRFLNSHQESWQALKYAVGGTQMKDYAAWQSNNTRPLDIPGFDRPRAEWPRGPTFHLFLRLGDANPDELQATLAAVRAQAYSRWCLYGLGDTSATSALEVFRNTMRSEPRLREIDANGWQEIVFTKIDPTDCLMMLDAGDILTSHALGAFAEEFTYAPDIAAIYSDEDVATLDGVPCVPNFNPDWSPIYHAATRYAVRSLCIRFQSIASSGAPGLRHLVIEKETSLHDILCALPRGTIGHIRRPLVRSTQRAGVLRKSSNPSRAVQPNVPPDPKEWPLVGIVIPTRDGAALLAECIRGLKETTDYPNIEIVIVDNGSTDADALALLRKLADDVRFKVLTRPGKFNFSAICNEGASATNAPILLFLNNDIVMQRNDWLKPMVRWAIQPHIGAVGAKLLFPNVRIQHAGVVLGLGGICGHLYRNRPGDYRGYRDRLTVPHEVAAVTAACVAIARTKFEAVGGFDAENLPIDLNDIDLCLRIAEYGWTNLWTPEAVLIHLQSSTRGIEKDPFVEYRKERNYFVQRWAHVIRDDPYFHPGLSLFAHDVELA